MNRNSTTAVFTTTATAADMGATSNIDDLARLLGTLSKGWGYGG